ncbi:hypothetical protein K503DRAFT_779215 [Rhizopogon vinicolor AM-OR11-026]|uniref:HMG box domain-containing protein n=1 Tax=Rhizopogon vinicolor AM-OR11-026 TaxID=1314800 RepID=A0A1B7NF80_9AGAM|nr:hypothetical protein K503DRAFT_779215 [Rhizopogon vinicolor AM-OR11-026]
MLCLPQFWLCLHSPRRVLPVAASKSASTVGAKKTTKKAVAKKPVAKKTAAKKAAPKKAKAKPRPKAKVKKTVEKPALPKRVPKSEQPPSRPPNAYILFFTKLAQNNKENYKSIEDTQAASKQAAATWKGFTLAEKQPYYDEVEVLKKQYDEKLHEYWKNAPPQIVRKINARRTSDGKKKIHRPRQESDHPRPMVPFFRFAQDFRQSPDGRAIKDAGVTSTGQPTVNIAREAGTRWRTMSDSEKAPYVNAYQTAYADWAANRPKTTSASASS